MELPRHAHEEPRLVPAPPGLDFPFSLDATALIRAVPPGLVPDAAYTPHGAGWVPQKKLEHFEQQQQQMPQPSPASQSWQPIAWLRGDTKLGAYSSNDSDGTSSTHGDASDSSLETPPDFSRQTTAEDPDSVHASMDGQFREARRGGSSPPLVPAPPGLDFPFPLDATALPRAVPPGLESPNAADTPQGAGRVQRKELELFHAMIAQGLRHHQQQQQVPQPSPTSQPWEPIAWPRGGTKLGAHCSNGSDGTSWTQGDASPLPASKHHTRSCLQCCVNGPRCDTCRFKHRAAKDLGATEYQRATGKRPCKSQRMRHRKQMAALQEAVMQDPTSCDPNTAPLPPSIEGDEYRKIKVVKQLHDLKHKMLALNAADKWLEQRA